MKQSKEQLPVALELPVAKFQVAEWGETAVAFIRLSAGADATPLLEGLPHDKCPCPALSTRKMSIGMSARS